MLAATSAANTTDETTANTTNGESADRPARPHSQRLLKEKVSLPTGMQGLIDGAYF